MQFDGQAIDASIIKLLRSGYAYFDEYLLDHLSRSIGKKLRSKIVVFLAEALNVENDQAVLDLCVAIESFHLSSLIHDDIVDESSLRRGVASINALTDSKTAVLVGDYVYGKAMALISGLDRVEINKLAANLTYSMAYGELIHFVDGQQKNISCKNYLKVIRNKTAKLFSVACVSSVLISPHSQNKQLRSLASNFALFLGYCFQILDDWQDYQKNTSQLGKKEGQDYYTQKMTLPVLHLLRTRDAERASNLFFSPSKTEEQFQAFKALLIENQSLDFTYKTATQFFDKAESQLDLFFSLLGQPNLCEVLLAKIRRHLFAVHKVN